MQGRIRTARDGARGTIIIEQPARRNAVTLDMWSQLADAVAGMENDPDLRTIVLSGSGTDAFSAGADISEFTALRRTPRDVKAYGAAIGAAQDALLSVRTPTIAAVRGICAGGGVAIALCCRIRFADETARFSIPASRIGLVYDRRSVSRLVDAVGPALAFDMLVSARVVGAEEALRIGLVNTIHRADELDARVEEYAGAVACAAPLSVLGAWVAIQAVEHPEERGWQQQLDELEWRAFDSDDHRRRVDAFLRKRRPGDA